MGITIGCVMSFGLRPRGQSFMWSQINKYLCGSCDIVLTRNDLLCSGLFEKNKDATNLCVYPLEVGERHAREGIAN